MAADEVTAAHRLFKDSFADVRHRDTLALTVNSAVSVLISVSRQGQENKQELPH